MTNLILHVGPGKCGSTSIQKFFFTQKDPCVEKINYLLLNPKEIRKLDSENPSETIIAFFTELLLDNIVGCDTLILSHEVLFQRPNAIKHICDLVKTSVTGITIIGYSRRQGDFLVSAYSQWYFRSLNRIRRAKDALSKLDIDPLLFSGLEQQLIAFIENDFEVNNLQDWYNSYRTIANVVSDDDVEIKCGVLPKKDSRKSLVQDFCEKANLTMHDDMKEASWVVANPSFNKEVVEAINSAVSYGLVEVPEFNENNIMHNKALNDAIIFLSEEMDSMEKRHQDFLSKLKAYIDTFYLNSNYQLCKKYNLDEAYFAPSTVYNKREILNIIAKEAKRRAKNKTRIIKDYRTLSARMAALSLKLAFDIAKLKKQNRTIHKKLLSKVQLPSESVLEKSPKLYAKLVRLYQRLLKR
jgi:hypothetical protein